MRILEKSKIKYNLSSLTSPVSAENRSDVLNGTAYRVKTSKGFQVKGVNFAPEAKKIYLQAENLFSANKYEEARNLYKKVLLLSPENTFLMTLIAQTYGIERKFDDAMNWYKKSIQANFIDCLAHWLLADIYRLKGPEILKRLDNALCFRIFAESKEHAGDVDGAGEAHFAAHALRQVAESDVLHFFVEGENCIADVAFNVRLRIAV